MNRKEGIHMKKKIVILGGGYGGLITSRKLEKLLKENEAEITLINKHEYHYVATQLHKTGAGTASDDKITLHIPDLLKTNKITFKKATVDTVDFHQQQVYLENGGIVLGGPMLVLKQFSKLQKPYQVFASQNK
jgi:NADH:ubiquinone reductase (H+-translocating)